MKNVVSKAQRDRVDVPRGKKKMRGRGNDSEGGKEVKLYRKMRG